MNSEYYSNETKKLQKRICMILSDFHDFCVENNLQYYAIGGTLLGAMRHHGFIPWDDDADVGMPREDFNRLCELLNGKKIKNQYLLESPLSPDKKYTFPYCKLYDTKTTLIENTRIKLVRGVYIDIFPLDGLGNTKEECKKNYKRINSKLNLLQMRKIKISPTRSFVKNAVLWGVQKIPDKIVSEKRLSTEINQLCESKSIYDYKFGGNLVGAWGFREIMEADIFGTPQLYDFEGLKIYGPEKAEVLLSNIYGDWKQLPPKEKQVSHHDRYLNLNVPYEEFNDSI